MLQSRARAKVWIYRRSVLYASYCASPLDLLLLCRMFRSRNGHDPRASVLDLLR